MENHNFFIPPPPSVHLTALLGGSPLEYCHPVWYGKTRTVELPDNEKTLRICITVTDRRTDILRWHSPRYAYALHGKTQHVNTLHDTVKYEALLKCLVNDVSP